MKIPKKLTLSLWLALTTALACADSVKPDNGADSNFQAPGPANADLPGAATALPDGTICYFFIDSFDGVTAPALPAGWVATNAQGTTPLWVTSTTTPDTAPNDAFIDDPATVSDKLLDTPTIAISIAGATVSFRNFYNLENTFDGAVLELSSPNINEGVFTDITDAAVGGSFITGGYNATISTAFGSPIAGRMAWSGNSNTYINTQASLGPNVTGRNIKLRFRMASDITAAGGGWRIDTIRVSAPGLCPGPTPTPTASGTPCAAVLSQNFDGVTAPALPAGWTTAATGIEVPWVTSTSNPASAPNDAFAPDVTNIGNTELITPVFFVPAGGAVLTFRNLFNMEFADATTGYDGMVLEISTAGVGYVDILSAGGSFVTGGYTRTISTGFMSPIAGRMAWSGLSGGTTAAPTYITTIVNLPTAVSGQNIRLKWRAATDNSSVAAGDNGVRVDNIVIAPAGCASPTPTPTPTATATAAPSATPTLTPRPTPTPTPNPPVITSPLTASTVVGQPFVYQFETLGATSLSVSNRPSGLLFINALRAIVGTPDAAGTFQVGLSASNSGGTTNRTLVITVQPPPPPSAPVIASGNAATGRVGQPFSFQVFTTGGTTAATITASGLPPGLSINAVPGVPGLISGTPTAEGSTAVTLTVTDGPFTTSASLQLTFTNDPARPVITSARAASLTPGQFFTYQITTDAPGQTSFTVLGTLPMGLGFDGINTISGIYTGPLQPELAGGALLGSIQLFGTNTESSSTFQLDFRLRPPSGVVNIATRLAVSTGENVLIGGFIITGNAPKIVLIRALGPSLNPFLAGALQDPTLELHNSSTTLVISNDNWKETQEQFIRETEIPPTNDFESAVVIGLDPGSYTAIVRGKNDTTGIAVVEVYDLGTASLNGSGNVKLGNIATRGLVGIGDNVMIGGFQIRVQATRVVVRAIGPSLSAFGISGALQDPTLELKDANGVTLISNDDWQQGRPPSEIQEIQMLGLAPSDPRESALITTPALAPGDYTAIVRGKNNTTGVALVEVYAIQ